MDYMGSGVKNETDSDQVRVITISPERAAVMLEANTHNRPLSASRVEKFANDMRAGNWKFTHQGVAFDSKKRLIDGQHRLQAVIQSGVTIQTFVFGGFDPDIFDVLDTGGNRSKSDALSIAGIPGRLARIISSAIPYCLSYEDGECKVNRSIAKKHGNTNIVTLKYYSSNPGLVESAVFVTKMPRRDAILKESISCFLHFQMSKKYNDADDFFSLLLTGDGVNGGVIAELRKMLIGHRIGNFRLVENTIINRAIAAYNYFHRGSLLKDPRQALSKIGSDANMRIS